MRYIVAPGRLIQNAPEGILLPGMGIPAGLLAQWGEAGLAANVGAGAVIDTEAATAERRPHK